MWGSLVVWGAVPLLALSMFGHKDTQSLLVCCCFALVPHLKDVCPCFLLMAVLDLPRETFHLRKIVFSK